MTALRIVVGLARAVRRQIGNTVLGGCNRRLESFVCFVQHQAGKALSLETGSTIVLRPTKSTIHKRFFYRGIHILSLYIFLFLILNQHNLCLIG